MLLCFYGNCLWQALFLDKMYKIYFSAVIENQSLPDLVDVYFIIMIQNNNKVEQTSDPCVKNLWSTLAGDSVEEVYHWAQRIKCI